MTKEEFQRRRRETGLTWRALAAELGVALHTVQRWDNGQSRIPSEAADRIRALARVRQQGEEQNVATTITPQHLGPEATELDAQAFNAALAHGADRAWLWNDGDYVPRLVERCRMILADPRTTIRLCEPASAWLKAEGIRP